MPLPSKINLTLFRPDHPRFRIMDAHLEVMHSLQWGLQALGVDCSMQVNQVDAQRTNILFGWIIGAQMGALADLRDDTILYNFEQFSERPLEGSGIGQLAQRFRIWDYSAANLPRWQACQPRHAPYHAAVSYAPVLSRIQPVPEDIDMLFIGGSGPGRQARLNEVSGGPNAPSLVVLQNLWGATRDSLIGRSRLLLNIGNDNPQHRIFEVVRVAHYLANRKAVVCEAVPGAHVEDDLRPALPFAARADLPATCERLLADPVERAAWAARGFEVFSTRDVREVLRRGFD